jgi:gliding motility-associated-like protein
MKPIYLLLIALFFQTTLLAQVYILNEDFVTTSGTNPPFEWSNYKITGTADDLWHFDNPGDRVVNFPVTAPFAVFDADTVSGNGQAEKVGLESPFFDASISDFILLLFDQTFVSVNGAVAIIEAFNGTDWAEVKRFNSSTANSTSEVVDISSVVGGITNAKIRFIWEGQSKGYWALDNVSIFAPLPIDGGLVKLDSPVSPFNEGVQPVKITIGNFGYQNLTSTTIKWKMNGVSQPNFTWNGNLSIGQVQEDVQIGTYNFTGNPVEVTIWQNLPNGIDDSNPYNDSIVKIVRPSLCGEYTIGGNNPDFTNFTEAVIAVNTAWISCPTIFKVRDGEYFDRLVITYIPGSSETNTVTFESESGDSTSVILNFSGSTGISNTILLNNAHNVIFNKMTIQRTSGQNVFDIVNASSNIHITHCELKLNGSQDGSFIFIQDSCNQINVLHSNFSGQNWNTPILYTVQGARNIVFKSNIIQNYGDGWRERLNLTNVTNAVIESNLFKNCTGQPILVNTSSNVQIIKNHLIDNQYTAISVNSSSNIFVQNNYINNSQGININSCSSTTVSSNRLLNVYNTNGIDITSSNVNVYNNYVFSYGINIMSGIKLNGINNSNISFNSINLLGTYAYSKSIELISSSNLTIRNNIFSIEGDGYSAYILDNLLSSTWDYNDYYSSNNKIGYINGVNYLNLSEWGQATQGDANSKNVPPYFAADDNPLPYQRDFNGGAIPIPDILLDINGMIRNDQAPDIGCVEFMIDFGVTQLISPNLDCNHGPADTVTVYLRQFGDVPFKDLRLSYQVNGGAIYTDTIMGTIYNDLIYTFKNPVNMSTDGEYNFRVWLINTRDDNLNNDTLVATRYSKPSPIVDFSYENNCTGREVFFTGTASVLDPYFIERYEWYFGDGDTSQIQNAVHTFAQAGTHQVTLRAYSNAGCYNEITKTISIDEYEKMLFDLVQTNEICSNSCNGEVIINLSGGQSPVQLFFNDQLITQNTINNLCPGDYIIRAIDNKGCEISDTIKIITESPMTLAVLADPVQGYAPFDVELSALVTGAASYEWIYKGETIGTEVNTTFSMTDPGDQFIKLIVSSGPPNYCTLVDSVSIRVEIFVIIDIPNAFTPNKDGYNDTFGPISKGLKSMEMKIKDRNGRLVHTIDEVDGRWDGTTESGTESPQGIYYYTLTATGYDEQTYSRQGSVNLFRDLIDLTPNPVTNKATLDMTGKMPGDKEILIYNASGILVRNWETSDDKIEMDLSGLSPGLFTIKLSGNDQIIIVKFIKE